MTPAASTDRPRAGRPAGLVPSAVDAAIAAAFVGLVVWEVLAGSGTQPPVVHALGAGLPMAALAWRRRFPLLVTAAVLTANLFVNSDLNASIGLSIVLLAFTCGNELDPPRSHAGLGFILLTFLGALYLEDLEASDVAAALVFVVGPWIVGVLNRRRSARAAWALARAAELEVEQATRAAQAAMDERTRIARELHDIVSHSLSVIAIQAQAVRRRLDPAQEREVADLRAVEQVAREALAEMRRTFGVLRAADESPSLAPQPGLAQLDGLVDTVRAAGLEVQVTVLGEAVDLSPGADLAAFRILQEGLTNALRHAGATRLEVTLRYTSDDLHLVVDDDGRGLPATVPAGHGLLGVRERVALYGGRLDLGPGPGGGTRYAATLPLRSRG